MTRTYSWTKIRDDAAAARPGARPEKSFDSDSMQTCYEKALFGRPTLVHVSRAMLDILGEGHHELLGQLQQPFSYAIWKWKQTVLRY